MKYNAKVSVKETNKMKKAGVVSQRIVLTLEMTFKKEDPPDAAAKAMGKVSAHIIEKTSLLDGYMTGEPSPQESPDEILKRLQQHYESAKSVKDINSEFMVVYKSLHFVLTGEHL